MTLSRAQQELPLAPRALGRRHPAPTTSPRQDSQLPSRPSSIRVKRLPAGRKSDDGGLAEQDVSCPRCHQGNSARRHFCRHCGAALPVAAVGVVVVSPVHEHWWRRLLQRVLPRKKAKVPTPATASEPPSAGSAGEAGHAPGPPGTPNPRLPLAGPAAMRQKEPRIRPAPAPPYVATARVPTLPKPTSAHLPSPKLLSGRTVAILVAAAAVVLLVGSQLAVHGPRGEYNRVRGFFYPHYDLIPVRSDVATNVEGCNRAQDGPSGGNVTTAYWFTPSAKPSGNDRLVNSSDLLGAPLLNVGLSQGDVARVGVTPLPVANAPDPLQLAIMVDNSRIQRVTLAHPPAFQTFSVHDGVGGASGARVEIWLLSTGGRPSPNTCALTAITFYSRS